MIFRTYCGRFGAAFTLLLIGTGCGMLGKKDDSMGNGASRNDVIAQSVSNKPEVLKAEEEARKAEDVAKKLEAEVKAAEVEVKKASEEMAKAKLEHKSAESRVRGRSV